MPPIWSILPFFINNTSVEPKEQAIQNYRWSYIKQFQCKQCIRYEADPSYEDTTDAGQVPCYCGRTFAEHKTKTKSAPANLVSFGGRVLPQDPNNAPDDQDQTDHNQWTHEACIKAFDTDSYGVLLLKSDSMGSNRPAEYVRVSSETEMSGRELGEATVLGLLTDLWSLKLPHYPRLVISVMGGCKNFRAGWTKDTFVTNLIDTVKSTRAWLLTDGLNKGVTRVVGQAVNKAQSVVKVNDEILSEIKCVGVVPYGMVKDNDKLVHDGPGQYKAAKYEVSEAEENGKVSLNGDHTHFLLVDDGYNNNKTCTDEFRTNLESVIQRSTSSGGLGVPVVVIVVDGRPEIIRRASLALLNNIPVVTVKGTGRAANVLAHAKQDFPQDAQSLTDLIEDEFENIDKETLANCLEWLTKCVEQKQYITVYDIDLDPDLEVSVLNALTLGEGTEVGLLKLALHMDRADIAVEHIVSRCRTWGMEDLYHIMTEALLNQKTEFVEIVLGQGVVMDTYLTARTLINLYEDGNVKEKLRVSNSSPIVCLRDIHQRLQKLIGQHSYEHFYDQTKDKFKDPYNELLLWAVMKRKKAVADYVWWKCKSPLSSALAATCVSASLYNTLSVTDTRARTTHMEFRHTFELNAVRVIDESYSQDQTNAVSLALSKNPTWGNITNLDLALLGSDMAFISTKCCQAIVDTYWRGLRWKFGLWLGYRGVLLALHVVLILFNLHPHPSLFEVLLALLVCFDALQKGIELLTEESVNLWKSIWNYYDVLTFGTFILSFALRFVQGAFPASKVLYAVCGVLFTCRLFRIYYIWARLGPMIIIFIRMTYKLLEFLALFGLFILAYGFGSNALTRHPCHNRMITLNSSYVRDFFEDVILSPYWTVYGELQLDELDSLEDQWKYCQATNESYSFWPQCVECEEGQPDCHCTESQNYVIWVKLMLAIYLIVGNVLLLNLLIAIFTNVFESIQKTSIEHWNLEMYRLMRLYRRKPILPPPAAPFIYLFRCLTARRKKVTQGCSGGDWNQSEEMLRLFERQQVRTLQAATEGLESPAGTNTANKLDNIMSVFASWVDNQNNGMKPDGSSGGGVKTKDVQGNIEGTLERVTSLSRRLDLLGRNLRDSQTRLENTQRAQHDLMDKFAETQGQILERVQGLSRQLEQSTQLL